MPPINVLIKPASSLCNLTCDYCFYCDEAEKRENSSYGFMSEETLKNVIRRTILKAEGQITYAFQGGEPTLCGVDFFEKVIKFQNQYNKNNIVVQNAIQTNGYLINDEWCSFLKKNNFLVGLSVDGIPQIHNSLRHERGTGKDTFDQVLSAANLMDKYKVEYNILTVVTADIVDNIAEVYDYYKKRGWNYQQYIACLDPLEEGHNKKDYSLTPEAYGEFLIKLFGLWYEDYKTGDFPYIRQFDNYIGIAAGYRPDACDMLGHCSMQNVIEADGSVYPCDFYVLDNYKLGNFNNDQLEVINNRRSEIKFIERSLNTSNECLKCDYFKMCRGGCFRHRDLNASTGVFDNYFCKSYKVFFENCYETIVLIGEKINTESNAIKRGEVKNK